MYKSIIAGCIFFFFSISVFASPRDKKCEQDALEWAKQYYRNVIAKTAMSPVELPASKVDWLNSVMVEGFEWDNMSIHDRRNHINTKSRVDSFRVTMGKRSLLVQMDGKNLYSDSKCRHVAIADLTDISVSATGPREKKCDTNAVAMTYQRGVKENESFSPRQKQPWFLGEFQFKEDKDVGKPVLLKVYRIAGYTDGSDEVFLATMNADQWCIEAAHGEVDSFHH